MARFNINTGDEFVQLHRKYDNLEKINKELTDYVSILKKNFDENKKKIIPLQEENSILTKTLIEKNEKIQVLELHISSLLKQDKSKDILIQEMNDKMQKYKEIFQFVTMKTKRSDKKPFENFSEGLNFSSPYNLPKKHGIDSPSLTEIDNGSPPMMSRAYSSIVTKTSENKPDFSRKSGKRSSNDFLRENSKIQEFQKEIEQFYSFDKKKTGIVFYF